MSDNLEKSEIKGETPEGDEREDASSPGAEPPEENAAAAESGSKNRKYISGANAAIVIVATLGIAILVNAISSQYFVRVDLTENQIYTLSEASKNAAHDLDSPVHINAFISPDLPAPMHNLPQSVADTLDEYVAASDGKITYEINSPKDGEAAVEAARGVGCDKVAIGRSSDDEVTVRAVYKCVAFSMGEDLEVVADLQPTAGGALADFEYDFTRALLNLQTTEPRKVAFVAGYGGPVANPRFLDSIRPIFQQLYGKLVKVQVVDLSVESAKVDDDITALIILNAEEHFSDSAVFALDQFIQRGGNVGWYQSATTHDRAMQQQFVQKFPNRQPPAFRKVIDPGLGQVFGTYGLELRPDLVLDPEHGVTALAMTSQGMVEVSHPSTFMMQNLDTELPFMRNFSAIALPAPSTVVVKASAAQNDALEIHRLVQTDASASRRTDIPRTFQYDVLARPDPTDSPGPWTVAAAVEGELASYYDNHSLPVGRTSSELGNAPASARVLVVGSGDFFRSVPELGYGQELAGLGAQFLLNSIEWLVQDSALSEIRSKSMPRLLGEVAAKDRQTLQFVNIATVPAIFAALGILMMMRRRRRKEALKRD